MTGAHRGIATHEHLHIPGTSSVHRLAPEVKLVGLLVYVVVVAVTPRRAVGAFAVDGVALAGVLALSRLPLGRVVRRLVVVTPFLGFALVVPFVAGGEQTTVAGLSLSLDGLWASWNITVKAVLGSVASIILAATTPVPEVLTGLSRLRVPAVVVSIVAFMFRYLDLLADHLHRMRRAMMARGHDPRWLWQARPIAASMGALFVRSYERGERVHQAMLARGWNGTMPELDARSARRVEWFGALVPGCCALVALVVFGVVT